MLSRWISENIKDTALARTLARARLMFEEIQSKQIIDGIILPSVTLTTGVLNSIPHKLARKAVGYIIINRSADCRIWDDQITNSQKDVYLKLRTSANVVVDIWVF